MGYSPKLKGRKTVTLFLCPAASSFFLIPLDNFRVDFDKDCEDPEYKPLQGPPKDQDDEVRNFHLSLVFLYY